MRFFTLTTSTLVVSISFAVPSPYRKLVRHEERTHVGHLVRRSRASLEITLPVRIGLSQNNLDLGQDLLMEISDPDSKKYGQHMSAKEVGDLFRPSTESVESVRAWLQSSGINVDRHQVTQSRGWLKFDATIEELESLLSTEYHIYQDTRTMEEHIGCDAYHVPDTVQPHVDFIFPTVSMAKVKRQVDKAKRNKAFKTPPGSLSPHVRPADIHLRPSVSDSTEFPCYAAVTPACIRHLYGIPMGNSSLEGNEIGIFEFGSFYDQQDLDLTWEVIAPYIPKGTGPILNGINGGYAPYTFDGEQIIGLEALLDMSIIMPLVYPQKSILYQVDDFRELLDTDGFGNTFLDALDASYCTFEGGDDPKLDPQYPNTHKNDNPNLPNGTWGEETMCGAYKPTNVISVSYGFGENRYSFFYENRQCVEYLKLGLQGVTVVYASGDSGVSDRGNCIVPPHTPRDDDFLKNPGAFSPDFPASCPWITSVGATEYNHDDKSETAVSDPGNAYYSGGGFSNYWPAPSYQNSTLTNYFTNYPPPYNNLTIYGTPYYNRTGRGYPDVSAIGLNYYLYYYGDPTFVGGTSASAPVIASIINLINEHRLAANKTSVGFINPTLYKNPQAFTDITTGNNPACNTDGFICVPGWDPLSGLGTPLFDKLLEVFMALP